MPQKRGLYTAQVPHVYIPLLEGREVGTFEGALKVIEL